MQKQNNALQPEKTAEQLARAPTIKEEDTVIYGHYEVYEIAAGRRTSILCTDDRDRVESEYNQLRTKGNYQLHLVFPSKMSEA